MSNALANATSPYLLQHADNPVHWREWGPEAFAEARRRNVPVLLSVGYAACHWCHVMAHESFEDAEVAERLNASYVAVKVDREERPDIDTVYMQATMAMTGRGGWPMTCFLTADGEPFFCGTYYPKAQFLQLLDAVAEAWNSKRDEVIASAGQLASRLREAQPPAGSAVVDAGALDAAVARLQQSFDARHGGFGGAPKFPPSMVLKFLLCHHARTGNGTALEMAERTLEAMARSGLCDQLGGGFARYSVDPAWVVPHFEKMLYDNALLLGAYLDWYRISGSPLALKVVRDTAGFLLRDLRTGEGGFASSLDADADGGEGSTYVWTPAQLAEVLGREDGARAARLLGVTDAGTFEHGTSTLQLVGEPPEAWPEWRERLLIARQKRVQPARDDKVVTAWNGLALGALAEAGVLLDEPAWLGAARECAEFLWSAHVRHVDDGLRLARASRDGKVGAAVGVAEDYGNLAAGLLALHQAAGERCWLERGGDLLRTALAQFAAPEGGFYDTAADSERLVFRARSQADNAEPCGNSALAGALLTHSALTGTWRDQAEAALAPGLALAGSDPRFAGWTLASAEAALAGPLQVAIVGEDDVAREMLAVARAATSPGLVLAHGTGTDPANATHPLLADRPLVSGQSAAYVCRGFVCELPVTAVDELRAELR